MKLETIEIDIDKDVAIPCPAIEFKLRRACKCCPSCEYYHGVGVMSKAEFVMVEGDESSKRQLLWHERFAVRCGHVIERRTENVKVVEE